MELKQFRRRLNFRELGGYPTEDGRTIKEGVFFRSCRLSLLNERELIELDKLGLKCILDMRSQQERLSFPDPIVKGAKVCQHSGLQTKGGDDIDFSPTGMHQLGRAGKKQKEDLFMYFSWIPYDNVALKCLFEEIKNHNTPILFHCASGKDRTGVASLLILKLLGCSKKVAKHDYLLSNRYLKEFISKEYKRHPEQFNDPDAKELLLMLQGVNKKVFEAIYNNILERSGSFENYFLQEHGIDEKTMMQIRDWYLI